MNHSAFEKAFVSLTGGRRPHQYQTKIAERLPQNRHLLVHAPTGAGKTLSVLVPFFADRERLGITGMIYVLPLRTLVEAVEKEAKDLAAVVFCNGGASITVKVQTGERPEAPFFADADIFITTFDQLLSGLLCEPYGLAGKLRNINAAAIVGKLIVFDEFHLMGPAEAFTTALFGIELFRDLCRSVWMTATATSSLTEALVRGLGATEVELSPQERTALFEGRGIRRALCLHLDEPLVVEAILMQKGRRVLTVVNQVARAQQLFDKVRISGREVLLLHSRFFADDRRTKQTRLNEWFSSSRDGIVIATQVIEAGVDLSAEVLLTELCPVNSLVQRAGRCARFTNESGVVHVHGLPLNDARPYTTEQLASSRRTLEETDMLSPEVCARWVEEAHGDTDRAALRGLAAGMRKREICIQDRVLRGKPPCAATFIRPGEDSVRVYILNDPRGVKPDARQAISLRRNAVKRFYEYAWVYNPASDQLWCKASTAQDIGEAYAVALPPSVAGYTREHGLRLGTSGEIDSPEKPQVPRPGYAKGLQAEIWADHTEAVVRESARRHALEGGADQFRIAVEWAARLHDLGKLQESWQSWAREWQLRKGKPIEEALAHTDYERERDRELGREVTGRPPHAAASAWYGVAYVDHLGQIQCKAALIAIAAHHGANLQGMPTPDHRLDSSAAAALRRVGLTLKPRPDFKTFERDLGNELVQCFWEIWPVAAYLTRVLRLSDQKATAEAGSE